MLRFSTVEEAEKATKLNGTRVEEHIIKVDMALRKEVEKEQILLALKFWKLGRKGKGAITLPKQFRGS